MNFYMRLNIILIILFQLSIIPSLGKEVDIFNLLLPTAYGSDYGHAQQLISTSGGCYQWSSTLQSILTVDGHPPGDHNCFKNGLVHLKAIGPYPSSIYITAKDQTSTELINIPVRVHDLKKISIFTKSKIMNLKEVTTLQVYGFDTEDNTFTSLEGLRFAWQLTEIEGAISKISIEQSSLFLPLEKRKQLEKQNFETDILVVQALSVGKIIVKVRCIEKGYQSIQDEITLYIQERFDLIPSLPVYLLAGSTFQFEMKSTNGQEILLPKPYYSFQVQNGFISDNKLLLTSPSKQAHSLLKVIDSRTSIPCEVSVELYAYEPDQLRIIVDQQILVGYQTNYHIQAYYKGRLLKGYAPMDVKSNFKIVNNKIEPLKKEEGKISVEYHGLRAQKKIQAVLPLQVLLPKKQVLLPIGQSFNLKIIGGSGYYVFQVKNHEIAMISFSGQILTKKKGRTTINVFDQKNKNNHLQIVLRVEDVGEISSLEEQKQANVHQETTLFIKAKNLKGQVFTSCNDIKFQLPQTFISSRFVPITVQSMGQLTQTDDKLIIEALRKSPIIPQGKQELKTQFKQYIEEGDLTVKDLANYIEELEVYGICSQVFLTGLKGMDGKITIQTEDGQKAFIPMRIYKPIENDINLGREIILTPYSSFLWKTTGGSQAWPSSETQIYLNDIKLLQGEKFPTINCEGKQASKRYKITYKNKQNSQLLRPVSQVHQILVRCQYPHSLQVYQNGKLMKNKIYLVEGQHLKGEIRAKTKKNQYFYNNSAIIWNARDQLGLSQIKGNKWIYNNKNEHKNFIDFQAHELIKNNEKLVFPSISKQYQIINLKPLQLEGGRIKIPFTKGSKYRINLDDTSERHLHVSCLDGSVLRCSYNEQKRQIEMNSQYPGKTKLIIADQTVHDEPSFEFQVQVLEPDRIQISTYKPQYMVDEDFIINVKLFSRGEEITHFNDDQVVMNGIGQLKQIKKLTSTKHLYRGTINQYLTLIASLKNNKRLTSNPLSILIYEPLQLNILSQILQQRDKTIVKSSIQLLLNCKNYISIVGGPPYLRTNLKTQPSGYAEVKKINERNYQLLGLNEGREQLLIEVMSHEQVIGEIKLHLEVKPIDKFEIQGNDQILKGGQFRQYSQFVSSNVQSECDFTYKWLTTNPNLQITSDNSFIGVNLTARNTGKSTVQVEILNAKGKVIGKAQKDIQIVDQYKFSHPSTISKDQHTPSSILLPPNSGFQFEEGTQIKVKSPCDEKDLVQTSKNKIFSKDEVGQTFIVLKKAGQIPTNIPVIISPIRSVFIANDEGSIKLSSGQHRKIRFHILDGYGRLFMNNLLTVEYDVTLSNPQIAQAWISTDRKYIEIQGKKNGKVFLTLSIKGQYISDIVPVFVKTYIQPSGPNSLHIGDTMKFSSTHEGDWVSSDPSILKIDAYNGWAEGIEEGEVMISKGTLSTAVKVFKIYEIQKVQQSSSKTQYAYRPVYPNSMRKYQGKTLQKNLQWSCELVGNLNSKFTVATYRVDENILCQIRSNDVSSVQVIPEEVKIRVTAFNKNAHYELSQQFTEKLEDVFVILGSHFRNASQENYHRIQIQTNEKLEVSQVNGYDYWIRSDKFLSNKQIIEVEMEPSTKRPWKLEIYNPKTHQREFIEFKTNIIEVNENMMPAKEESQGWSWIDILIAIMSINFLIILFIQCNPREGPIKVY